MNKTSDRINLMYYYNNVEAGRKQTSTLHTHTYIHNVTFTQEAFKWTCSEDPCPVWVKAGSEGLIILIQY